MVQSHAKSAAASAKKGVLTVFPDLGLTSSGVSSLTWPAEYVLLVPT